MVYVYTSMYAIRISIYCSDLQETFVKKYGILGKHEYTINGAVTVSLHFKFPASKRNNSHLYALDLEYVYNSKELNADNLCRQKEFDCSGCEILGVKPSG